MKPILLVDDNPDDRELIALALADAGFRGVLDTAVDGVDALERLLGEGAARAPLPRVVLLDLMLPRLDGFDVLERLRAAARTRYLPVVVLSSSDSELDIERAYALGANAYVKKPVQLEALAETVRRLAGFWLRENRSPSDEGRDDG